jgi:hypothetical protein
MTKAVGCLPSKHEVLSSNPSSKKKKKLKRGVGLKFINEETKNGKLKAYFACLWKLVALSFNPRK